MTTSDGGSPPGRPTRPISWVKAARKAFDRFPVGAQGRIQEALTVGAEGGRSVLVRPLHGLGSGVLEVALPYHGNAFRVVYALHIGTDLWVIHAFQKKSTHGISTPLHQIELIVDRIRRLKEIHT